MQKIHLFLISFFILATGNINAQEITNVKAKTSSDNKTIIVTYDVLNSKTEQTFDISLWMSKNGGSYKKINKSELSGHIGTVKVNDNSYKKSSKIVYDPLKYNKGLHGNIEFEVRASVTSGGSVEMVFVKGGTFTMGSSRIEFFRGSDETQHSVTVSDFYIGKYEVTQKQWKEIMGSNPSYHKGDNLPVEQVSWNNVQDFIKKLNSKTGQTYRLPTEAEWEFAAKGGNKSRRYKYAGSNSIESVAWNDINSGSKTHNVGTKSPNELGIYDMTGNVWEWCSDWYKSRYYSKRAGRDPKGASNGSGRVLRGGSSSSVANGGCRSANRNNGRPGYSENDLGFRLAFVP